MRLATIPWGFPQHFWRVITSYSIHYTKLYEMGIDPNGTLPHPSEGTLPLLPSLGKKDQSNGLLYELINSQKSTKK